MTYNNPISRIRTRAASLLDGLSSRGASQSSTSRGRADSVDSRTDQVALAPDSYTAPPPYTRMAYVAAQRESAVMDARPTRKDTPRRSELNESELAKQALYKEYQDALPQAKSLSTGLDCILQREIQAQINEWHVAEINNDMQISATTINNVKKIISEMRLAKSLYKEAP
jgi:hypothetical protein